MFKILVDSFRLQNFSNVRFENKKDKIQALRYLDLVYSMFLDLQLGAPSEQTFLRLLTRAASHVSLEDLLKILIENELVCSAWVLVRNSELKNKNDVLEYLFSIPDVNLALIIFSAVEEWRVIPIHLLPLSFSSLQSITIIRDDEDIYHFYWNICSYT